MDYGAFTLELHEQLDRELLNLITEVQNHESSTAVNDLKDGVFQGNEEAYYLAESVFAFATSAMIPIGQAASAGKLTFRSGATIVAKEGIATAAGVGAQKYATDLTGNQTAGMIAGMAASMATAKGLNGIEAGAKKLAKPKLGGCSGLFCFSGIPLIVPIIYPYGTTTRQMVKEFGRYMND